MELIAKWASKGGAHVVELYRDQNGFRYSGPNCSGSWPSIVWAKGPDCPQELKAQRLYEARYGAWIFGRYLRNGHFLPDSNKTGLTRVL